MNFTTRILFSFPKLLIKLKLCYHGKFSKSRNFEADDDDGVRMHNDWVRNRHRKLEADVGTDRLWDCSSSLSDDQPRQDRNLRMLELCHTSSVFVASFL